jgi:hypothetical protein
MYVLGQPQEAEAVLPLIAGAALLFVGAVFAGTLANLISARIRTGTWFGNLPQGENPQEVFHYRFSGPEMNCSFDEEESNVYPGHYFGVSGGMGDWQRNGGSLTDLNAIEYVRLADEAGPQEHAVHATGMRRSFGSGDRSEFERAMRQYVSPPRGADIVPTYVRPMRNRDGDNMMGYGMDIRMPGSRRPLRNFMLALPEYR